MKRFAALSVAAIALSAGAAHAGPWTVFEFVNAGVSVGPFTLTTTAAEPFINVTDAGLSGDRFRIDFLTGPLAGTQHLLSSPSFGDAIGGDFDAAFGDLLGRWSRGAVFVGPATFDFNIFIVDSPFGGGGAAFRTSDIPAPGAAALVGLGGLAVARRRRR